jgi:hypothetical protein
VEEVLEEEQEGLLFEPGDAADLARAIGLLLDDPRRREQIAESGYQRVRQKYPASATRRLLQEAYLPLVVPLEWCPPQANAPIDALPSHPDTTARRPSPFIDVPTVIDSDPSSELEIPPTNPRVVAPTTIEIEIEAEDFVSAGEARDATIETNGVILEPAEPAAPGAELNEPDTIKISLQEIGLPLNAPLDEDLDEKTGPGPLRPRRPSG